MSRAFCPPFVPALLLPAALLLAAGSLLLPAACRAAAPAATAGGHTGSAHRVLIGDDSKHIIAIVNARGEIEWRHDISQIHDAWVLPSGNVLFQTNWQTLLEVQPDGKEVWRYDAAKMNGNAGRNVEVHAFERLPGGLTMIAESGVSRILEVDSSGQIEHQMPLQVSYSDTHRDTRNVRKLANGNYLAAQEADKVVREYEPSGKVVWQYEPHSKVYSALRLASGNTLIGAGDGHRAIEVDPAGKTVWSVEEKDLPGITLAWVTLVDRLPNGNTVIVNCHAGANNPQIIEVTPKKEVVWTFKDYERFGNSMPVARVLDVAR